MAQANPAVGGFVMRTLQGRERNLPEDFVAHISGDELKMTLKSLGVDQGGSNQDLVVTLIQNDGTKVEATPDADGNVKFSKFSEGLTALVVTGQQAAYAAMAFYIDQKNKAEDKAVVPDPAPARTSSFNVPLANVNRNQVRSAVDSSGNAQSTGSIRPLKDFTTKAASRFRVYLQPDGTLIGRVIVPEEGFQLTPGPVNLSFYRNGSVVANTVTSNDGDFFVQGLNTGVHSVFAAGAAGHAAYSFEIVPSEVNQLPKITYNSQSRVVPVSTRAAMQVPASDELIVLLIPPRLMPAVRETVDQTYPLAPPVVVDGIPMDAGFAPPMDFLPFSGAGGGFAGAGGGMSGAAGGATGGGGGLGGLGGGLGGIGGLLGIGGLAAGVAAVAANNDDSFVLPPASVIVP